MPLTNAKYKVMEGSPEDNEKGMIRGKAPLVKYTAFHEKLVYFLVKVLIHPCFVPFCIFVVTLSLGIPLSILIINGDWFGLLTIWLPIACGVIGLIILIPILSRGKRWETLDGVDNDFYEPVLGSTDKAAYTPRKIKELYYSQGVWRTTSTDQCIKFRGINIPAKTPSYGNDPAIFYPERKNVSFIDAPFPLNTAREHFQRLSNYGFNLLRLTVTWEAVMHEGPGVIDTAYLNYLSSLVDIAAEFGLYVIIDPHQDVWSRFTGGDGAPWWTLDAAGFVTDSDRLHQTGCAFVDHLQNPNDPPPKMIWPTNYGKLATATMFTLFFAGDKYAPGVNVDETYSKSNGYFGVNEPLSMQQFLQKYYLQFIDVVAEKVKNKSNVIGFNSMNEPSNGYAGIKDLAGRTMPMPFGVSHSYFDGMRLGCGETLRCQYYSAPFMYHSTKEINPDGLLAWKTPAHDIWKQVGVYSINSDTEKIELNRPHYFALKDGENFIDDHMVPLFQKIQTIISGHNKKFILYAEPFIDINDHKLFNAPESLDGNKYAWSPHWYDATMLIFKKYFDWLALDDEKELPVFSRSLINSTFKRILGHLSASGNGKLHVVLGETGVPFDMPNNVENNFADSTRGLDRVMQAIEANNLDFTLWNYYPENTLENGDNWCGEDLSVRMKNGNRALLSLVRPFAYQMSSDFEIVKQTFDPSNKSKKYELILKKSNIDSSTIEIIYIYLPHLQFPNPVISTSVGYNCTEYKEDSQLLIWDLSKSSMEGSSSQKLILSVENGF
jgi:hypothetical protein